jgi:KDO2-lipid IV(A) lauroyltransferase
MSFRAQIRLFKRSAGILLYQLPLFLASLLPTKAAYGIARGLGRRKFARLRAALQPQAANAARRLRVSPDVAEDILQRSFEHAACENLEAWLFSRARRKKVLELVEIRGLENLRTALDRGRGAILYSGHFRSHLTFAVAMGLLGFKQSAMIPPLAPEMNPIERWLCQRSLDLVADAGLCWLFISSTGFDYAVKAAHALKRNELLFIEIDQTFSEKNVIVPWMNGRARFPYGPARLARATGAPLLSFYLYRSDQWMPLIMEIGSPFWVTDDLAGAMARCAAYLEEKIREHPASWIPWLFPKPRLWEGLDQGGLAS